MGNQIKTANLVIRPFVAADAPRVTSLLNDYAVSKWLQKVPHPFKPEDLYLFDEDGSSRWPGLAAIAAGPGVVGAISMRADHLGYWIGAAYWRRGFGSEAVSAAVRYLFDASDEDIRSGVFEGNKASLKILQRLGFREIGRGVEPCLARGEDIPHIDLCLTRSAWLTANRGAL